MDVHGASSLISGAGVDAIIKEMEASGEEIPRDMVILNSMPLILGRGLANSSQSKLAPKKC